MKIKPSILIIMYLTYCNFYCYNAKSQTISKEKAFFYFVKIYNYSVTTPVQSGGGYSQCGNDLLTHYAYVFDKYNYLQSRNDEFKRHEYTKSITSKFQAELAKVNFEKKFTVSCRGSFGEYSFENSSFPINFTEKQYQIGYRIPFYNDDCYMEINIGEIINLADFKWYLAYPPEKAQNLVSKRKYSDGQINRTIFFKLTYSIVNKTSSKANSATNLNGSNIIIYVYSIDIYEDEGLNVKLGTFNATTSNSTIAKDIAPETEIEAQEFILLKKYIKDNNITVQPTASGLYYIEKIKGTGPRAMAGMKVRVSYTGKVLNGKVFDSSVGKNPPYYEFTLGAQQVIKGWEEGIAKMHQGGKATLITPSNLAYGARSMGSDIPPYTTLIFDVELVYVQ